MSFTDKDTLLLEFPLLADADLAGEFASDEQIDDLILEADALIESYLIPKYSQSQVDIWKTTPHESLKRLATFFVISNLLGRVGNNDNDINKLNASNHYYKKYKDLLNDILTGKMHLVATSKDIRRYTAKAIKYDSDINKYRI